VIAVDHSGEPHAFGDAVGGDTLSELPLYTPFVRTGHHEPGIGDGRVHVSERSQKTMRALDRMHASHEQNDERVVRDTESPDRVSRRLVAITLDVDPVRYDADRRVDAEIAVAANLGIGQRDERRRAPHQRTFEQSDVRAFLRASKSQPCRIEYAA